MNRATTLAGVALAIAIAAGAYVLLGEKGPEAPGSAPTADAPAAQVPLTAATSSSTAPDTRIERSRIEATLAGFPPEVKSTLGDVGYDDATGRTTITELKFEVPGPQGTVTIALNGVALKGGSAANAAKVFDPASYATPPAADGEKLDIVDEFVATSLTVTPPDGANRGVLKASDLVVRGFKARQFAQALPNTLAALSTLSYEQTRNVLQSTAFETLSLRNIALENAGKTPMKMATFVIQGFDGNKATLSEITGLDVSPPEGEGFRGMSIGRLSLRGADIWPVLDAARSGDGMAAIAPSVSLDGYEVVDVSVRTESDSAPVTMKSLIVSDIAIQDGVATKAKATLTGLSVPLTSLQDPQAKAMVTDLGLSALAVDGGFDYAFDPASKTMDLKEFRLAAQNVGTLTLGFEIIGFDPATFQAARAGQQPDLGQLMALQLGSLSIRWDDAGITDKAMTFAAKEQGGMALDQYREQLKAMVTAQGQALPEGRARDASNEVVTYLGEPKGLLITATPAQPVPLATLGAAAADPNAAMEQLNLVVKANP
ncbi:hypothetical protein [Zavarzinia sp. CC-PAN008]|uniref:hypothetical protein n=1 Tax=Zavarzinia sp. CC-PAN008 TaxID=3243332 RepID=UPI003F746122